MQRSALSRLAGPIFGWVHRPNEGKSSIASAYGSLSDRHKEHLDAHTKEVFEREHGSDTAVVYRYRDSGKYGLASVSPVKPTWIPADQVTALRIKASDVLAHYAQEGSPLASKAFGHEKEIILKPDANPEVIPRDEHGRFTTK